jgi:CheY-like chemotaxis protein
MGIRIGIEDLVANALIEMVDDNENNREVTYSQLEQYGAKVIEKLNEKQEGAVLIISKERTNAFLHDYSDFFQVRVNEQGEKCIALVEGKTTDELRKLFRGYMSLDMLMAFINDLSLQTLGISQPSSAQ